MAAATSNSCRSRRRFPLFDAVHQCLNLDALIRVKRAAGRPKDFEAIAELEALREQRGG